MQNNPQITTSDSQTISEIAPKTKKPFFVLSRKNQKGQVAIFVALIFQIVFIFFALLINVGLLVHHKINLQQSTDLAAYYGAMKQAEMLNVISHVNFQIRQAWKLLTWRYRVLGTFGMTRKSISDALELPIANIDGPMKYNSANNKCPGTGVNLNDVPAFCLAHVGYTDWSAPAVSTETYCKLDCITLTTGASNAIQTISGVGSFSYGAASVGGSINTAITSANNQLQDKCQKSTVFSAMVLSNFLSSYLAEREAKLQTVKAIFANLSNGETKFIDINGDLVSKGSKNTFLNNLTEANKVSNTKFATLNGLSDDESAGRDCTYSYNNSSELFEEVLFKYIAFYQLACKGLASGPDFQFVPVANADTTINAIVENQFNAAGKGPELAQLRQSFSRQIGLGIEKNPWCLSYYGVKSQSEPKIPFLPISKIKLSAIAFAKPFGGSIGPRFFKTWERSESATSRSNKPETEQVDMMLPLRSSAGVAANLKSSARVTLNFSNYVGDDLGLARPSYLGAYHDLLMGGSRIGLRTAGISPAFASWIKINNPVGDNQYDPLAATGDRVRDLEISVVAPNQFDLSYFSIDSDFYNNYYVNKMEPGKNFINNLQQNTGASNLIFTQDYGYDKNANLNYSVLKQLQKLNDVRNFQLNALSPAEDGKKFSFIPQAPASLLTGWTFLNLTSEAGYTTFPDKGQNTTMPFGTCKDSVDVNVDYKTIADSSVNPPKPPTPGNCVTGGRTGYSVKIISSEAINGPQGDIGGAGTGGQQIRNPIPETFLTFTP